MGTMKVRKIFGVSLSLILINMAAVMERADENLLPSVYKEVSQAFNVGPADLGYLTFVRNFVRGLASPLAGILVIHYDRPTILAVGTLFWAVSTAAVGASQQFMQVAFWRAINGFGLAIVIPALQSFIADSYREGVRGTGFGMLSFIGSLGGIGGGVVATVMAGHEFWGVPGWRVAFIMMACLSMLIGLLVFLFVVDPRKYPSLEASERNALIGKNTGSSAASIWKESVTAMKTVLKVPTFRVIVLQGLMGSLPWTAMVFFTMCCPVKSVCFWSASGALVGGMIADKITRKYPHSGRTMCAQFSASMGIPFSWFLLTVIPQSVNSWFAYATTLFLMGLIISWNGAAANAPMFAQVVPAKHRTMIYSFDRAFEGSFSSFAAPLVGILSEKIYGYDPKSVNPDAGSVQEAYALSRGLLTMMAVPFGLCCLFYTPLYWVFKHDREKARLASLREEVALSSAIDKE
ncbi:Protein spinster [Bienertia sinuspersici]